MWISTQLSTVAAAAVAAAAVAGDNYNDADVALRCAYTRAQSTVS